MWFVFLSVALAMHDPMDVDADESPSPGAIQSLMPDDSSTFHFNQNAGGLFTQEGNLTEDSIFLWLLNKDPLKIFPHGVYKSVSKNQNGSQNTGVFQIEALSEKGLKTYFAKSYEGPNPCFLKPNAPLSKAYELESQFPALCPQLPQVKWEGIFWNKEGEDNGLYIIEEARGQNLESLLLDKTIPMNIKWKLIARTARVLGNFHYLSRTEEHFIPGKTTSLAVHHDMSILNIFVDNIHTPHPTVSFIDLDFMMQENGPSSINRDVTNFLQSLVDNTEFYNNTEKTLMLYYCFRDHYSYAFGQSYELMRQHINGLLKEVGIEKKSKRSIQKAIEFETYERERKKP